MSYFVNSGEIVQCGAKVSILIELLYRKLQIGTFAPPSILFLSRVMVIKASLIECQISDYSCDIIFCSIWNFLRPVCDVLIFHLCF